MTKTTKTVLRLTVAGVGDACYYQGTIGTNEVYGSKADARVYNDRLEANDARRALRAADRVELVSL